MGDGSTSHPRKVRGTKITTDRSEKRLRRAKQRAERDASGGEDDDAPTLSPEEAAPDPFVVTDEITALVDRITGWLEAEQPVHLIGPTGCGKTALALHAAARRGRPVVWIDGDSAVDTAALVGEHAGAERYKERDEYVSGVRKETEIVQESWVDNPLTVAVREGATLVYNEFSRSDPAAHNVLLSVLEEGVLDRPGKRGADRQIDVHPDFGVIVTSNSAEYAGVHEQQDALLDRFVGVYVDTYGEETEREIVAAHSDLASDRIEQIVSATRALRAELDLTIGTRTAIMAAKGVSVFDAAESDGVEGGDEGAETDGGDKHDGDEHLVDVFTDVLAPKVAENGDVNELRTDIEDTLH